MKPVLGAAAIREADAYTIQHEPISALDLMERAGAACAIRLRARLAEAGDPPVLVIAGMGNNGGDGLVIARRLAAQGIRTQVLRIQHRAAPSPENAVNWERLCATGISVKEIGTASELPGIPCQGNWIVDALFGTGLHAPLQGLAAEAVHWMNRSGCPVMAIDLPSGMPADPDERFIGAPVVQARRTFTLEVPKLSLLLPEHGEAAGAWELVPIGLDGAFIARCATPFRIAEVADAARLLTERPRFGHKGRFGHALIMAGQAGSMGAALLATRACSRSGAGLVTAHVPAAGRDVMQMMVPEALCSTDPATERITMVPPLDRITAVGCGPGIGTGAETAAALRALIASWEGPLVLDADALNILAQDPGGIALPAGRCVLTPHPKEFDRLAGRGFATGHERLLHAVELAARLGCVIVLKGAFSAICAPDGNVVFNPTGNPGMAKGGSGDALTGIIAGLLAQGLSPMDACLLGTYAHGLAGDIAAERMGMDGMTVGDLLDALPAALARLRDASVEHA